MSVARITRALSVLALVTTSIAIAESRGFAAPNPPPLPPPQSGASTAPAATDSTLPPLPPPDGTPPPAATATPTPEEIVPSEKASPHTERPVFESPPPLPPKDPNKELRPFLLGQGGVAFGRLFDIPFTSGAMRLGGGFHSDRVAVYGAFDLLYGSTNEGLRTWDASLAAGADVRIARRFRLGGGFALGVMAVRRVTFDDHIQADYAGMFVHGSADVWSFGFRDDHAVFVDAAARGNLFFGGTAGALVLSAGFRY